MFTKSHAQLNQENYKNFPALHDKLNLNSTLLLAYRDVPYLLHKHLFARNKKTLYKFLDFGCGVGLSTEIVSKIISDSGYQVDILGVDINTENLKISKERVPHAKFLEIKPEQSLGKFGEFDLILCNFVLVENEYKKMVQILKYIQPLLSDKGVLIITNCTSKVYQRSNKWYSFNNDFLENEPAGFNQGKGKVKYRDDQPVKLTFSTPEGSFTFFDFFHSGKAYRKAYEAAGFNLSETHKPIGYETDGMPWKSEVNYSPYKIHVLYKCEPMLSPTIKAKL